MPASGGADVAELTPVNIVVSVATPPPAPAFLETRVSASSDDAEEFSSRRMSLRSPDLELITDRRRMQTVGMRFNAVTIPSCAVVTNAYVQFQANESQSVSTSLNIRMEKNVNALQFARNRGNITSRTRTMASVAWSPVPWNTVGAAGLDQRTPDITSLVQEVIKFGWVSGNSLAVIIDGTGHRTAESFDGVPGAAPLLHVDFDATACP